VTLLQEILEFNAKFVSQQAYEEYQTTKFPDKRLVILSCMDTRLTELLPRAMNFKNGDVKMIKNAGAIVSHPFGSVMRSILVAIYELQAQEVCIIGHHGCGMSTIDPSTMIQKTKQRGVSEDTIDVLERGGVDLEAWLMGFENVEESVRKSVTVVKQHPLMPADVPVHGLVIDPSTGQLDVVIEGYSYLDKA
jgi:carbonic anhydrase